MVEKIIAFLFCCFSLFFLLFQFYDLGLFFSVVSYLIILNFTLKTVGFNSILFIFLILFGLYGYSVPISVYYHLDIGWHRVAKLSTWEKVDSSLYSYLISNQLALLAIIILFIFFVNRKIMNIKFDNNKTIKYSYLRLALIAGFLSSISALINFLRVGGFTTVLKGKAYYQGAVNDLVLNIPYEGFFYISIALFSLFLINIKVRYLSFYYAIQFIGSISFVLFINLIIGERGLLVIGMAIFFLGYYSHIRMTSLKFKYLIILSVLYILFNTLTLLREKSIKYNGAIDFYTNNKEMLYRLMNPANTEFAASAFNYRIFYHYKESDYQFELGKTYTEILVAFFPTYIYPNKPKSITYKFRDEYFPERKKQGSSAGTGFSSLMEAYMNFGYFGPFIIYFIFVFIIIYIESKRGEKSLLIKCIYLLLLNILLIFSRSASQYILFTSILYFIQVIFVVLLYKYIPKKFFLNNDNIKINE
ncbi:O-antigen polymerase [Galbibacter sp. BG1]